MNQIIINGSQEFMGKEIPVVLGGFGNNKKCMSDKTIAGIHGVKIFHIREKINDNIKRFTENIDFIDLKIVIGESDNNIKTWEFNELLKEIGYTTMQIAKAEHIYILSERGYAKLIKIMDTDLAWVIHDKLMDEYFQLRDDPFTGLSKEMLAAIANDKRITVVSDRVTVLEDTMTVDYGMQQDLQNIANTVALKAIGGKKSRAYTYQREPKDQFDKPPKLFGQLKSRLWRDYKDYFGINSYKNTPRKQIKAAKDYLTDWVPPINMQLEIAYVNEDN